MRKGEQFGSYHNLNGNPLISPKAKGSRGGGVHPSRSSHLAYPSMITNQSQSAMNSMNSLQSPSSKSMSFAHNPVQSHRQVQENHSNGSQKPYALQQYFQDQQQQQQQQQPQQQGENQYLLNGKSKQQSSKKSASTTVSAILSTPSSIQLNQLSSPQNFAQFQQQQHQQQSFKGDGINQSQFQLPKLPLSHHQSENGKQNHSSTFTNINQNTINSMISHQNHPSNASSTNVNNSHIMQGNLNYSNNAMNSQPNNSSASKNTLRNIAKYSSGNGIPSQSQASSTPYALAGTVSPTSNSLQENILPFSQPRQSLNQNQASNSSYSGLGLISPMRPPSNPNKDIHPFQSVTKNNIFPQTLIKSATPKQNGLTQFSIKSTTPTNQQNKSLTASNSNVGVLSPSNKVQPVRTLNLEITPQKPASSKNNSVPQQNSFVQNVKSPLYPNQADLLDPKLVPKIEKSKISSKPIGIVQAYGANTHQGLVRGYNEDRVSIILNMVKPQEKHSIVDWPNISYFAIYDGHGGANCADYLRDQLHFYIVKDEEFPKNPMKAIHNGFVNCEEDFLKIADSHTPLDKSGSCAIVVILINDTAYVANLGDSRAVLSCNNGSKVVDLTVDHKPNFPGEEKRILANGGKIYQQLMNNSAQNINKYIKGPHRVLPGRLAVTSYLIQKLRIIELIEKVSRTMGDAEAKLKKYGGNSKVILCEPEITSFKLNTECDFVMLGCNNSQQYRCDGIFDKLSNEESINYLWENLRESFAKREFKQSVHEYVGDSIEYLLRQTFLRKSFDNLTVVIVCLSSLEKIFS